MYVYVYKYMDVCIDDILGEYPDSVILLAKFKQHRRQTSCSATYM